MRKRMKSHCRKFKQKNKNELNASVVSPEHTSLDEALEEISEKMEEGDKLHNQQPRKIQKMFSKML